MKNTNDHFGLVSIIAHWLVAILVFILFGLGLWMVELTYYDSWYKTAPDLHKSIGLFLFALMTFRLYWRFAQIQPQSLSSHSKLERKLGSVVHKLLYILLFLIMLSGYMISTADARAIEVFGLFEVPGFGSLVDNQEDIAGLIHQYLAYLIIGLVSLHALAALKHHFIDKDKTLTRMLGKRG
jgi:cytochrome b561